MAGQREQGRTGGRADRNGPSVGRRAISIEWVSTADDVLQGLDRDQFALDYQPIVSTVSGAVERYEALSRWQHPRQGRLAPASFIDLTEGDAVAPRFTIGVLGRAVRDCATWRRGGIEAGVAVNVSPGLLGDGFIPRAVRLVLDRYGLAPEHLTIEVTEGFSAVEIEQLETTTQVLRHMGVRMSLDDFGQADASLARLQRLRVDEIKIDRDFVTRLPDDARDLAIVRFLSALAADLGLAVVAEGVEREETLLTVAGLGVGAVQGFHLGAPIAAPLGARGTAARS